jgi:hypothetical protein
MNDDVGVVYETHALCQGGKERNMYCRFKLSVFDWIITLNFSQNKP